MRWASGCARPSGTGPRRGAGSIASSTATTRADTATLAGATTGGHVSGSSTDRFRRADAIFDAALDVPDDEQTAYVARACANDTELRAEVLGLLRASHSAGGVLDGAAAQMAAQLIGAGASPDAAVPARVGAYRVVREI